MSWHSGSWPGLLALLLSPDPEDVQFCLSELWKDWQALQTCRAQGQGSLFLKNLALMSPLNLQPMADLQDLLAADGSGMTDSCLAMAKELALHLWGGWGQSK
eukprot:5195458-Lingulodinium_polyedra.AAC.1